jgi:hypothetical protein
VEKLLSSGWSDLSREMRPGNAVGVLGVLYIGQGDKVRVRGRMRMVSAVGFETEKEREGRCSGAA